MDYPPSPPAKCPERRCCGKLFQDHKSLGAHMWAEFMGSEGHHHIHCRDCQKTYPSIDALHSHAMRNHGKDQNLRCPACQQHFVKVSALMLHIEQNLCKYIGSDQFAQVRENRMRFARGLQARHQGDYDEETEALYMSRNSALRPKAEATVRPYPVQFEQFETEMIDSSRYYSDKWDRAAREEKARQATIEANRKAVEAAEKAVDGSNRYQESLSQAIEDSARKPQILREETPPPHKRQRVRMVTPHLLDVFDDEDLNAINEYSASCYSGSPRSISFNPWDDDDLICMSTHASGQAPTPDYSPAPTARARSPATSDHPSSSAPTIIVPREVAAAAVGQAHDTTTSKISQSTKTAQILSSVKNTSTFTATKMAPSEVSGSGPGSGSQSSYQPRKLMPLKNYEHYIKAARSSNQPAQDTPTSLQPRISQVVTPTKTPATTAISAQMYGTPEPAKMSQAVTPDTSSAAAIAPGQAAEPSIASQALALTKTYAQALAPVQAHSTPETAKLSQALTPARGSGAVELNNAESPVADYGAIKDEIANIAAQHNPQNPDFNVHRYWNPVLGKYKCAIPGCFKSFKKPGQLEHHLKEHQKSTKVKYPCPSCHDHFDSLPALLAHTESQSIRCKIRLSKNYGHFLAQATAGMIDVIGEDTEHATMQFAVSKEAKQLFAGGAMRGNEETRRSRSDEFKAATAALEDRATNDEEEEKRKMWEDHEREIEVLKAKERERERSMQAKKEQVMAAPQQKASTDQDRSRQAKAIEERQVRERKAQEAQWDRDRQVRAAQKAQEQKAREEADKQAMERARMEQERNLQQQQKAREAAAEQERFRAQKMEYERNLQQQKARDAAFEQTRRAGAANTSQIRPFQGQNQSQGPNQLQTQVQYQGRNQFQGQNQYQGRNQYQGNNQHQGQNVLTAEQERLRRAKKEEEEEETRRIREQRRLEQEEDRRKRAQVQERIARNNAQKQAGGSQMAPSNKANTAPATQPKMAQSPQQQRQTQGLQSVQANTQVPDTALDARFAQVEEAEHALMEQLKKMQEVKWKIQQEKEKRAIEQARKEQEARREQEARKEQNSPKPQQTHQSTW